MNVVQFQLPDEGPRVGIVVDGRVSDVTAEHPQLMRVVDVFTEAERSRRAMNDLLAEIADGAALPSLDYAELLAGTPGGDAAFLRPPIDHEDPRRLLVTGTGLTHLGSMQSRDQMHADENAAAEEEMTDSRRMFEMGLRGGKPQTGQRGAAPEWFYKGNGLSMRGHGEALTVPAFARDGGEEVEIVGCYLIDQHGTPRRLGFALGNEWSDHATEKLNYLYLAPSKLMEFALGPELITDFDFQEVRLRCTVRRGGEVLYDSGELLSGERHMCHSLANCEDHHFKYPQHRVPGDVHLHFFGTSKLSYSTRDWLYQDGDEVRIEADRFGAALVNTVRMNSSPPPDQPVRVEPA